MAYTITNLVTWGDSVRQWRVVKGLDADDGFSITHGLSVNPLLLPTVTPEGPTQAVITANKAALPSVDTKSGTVLNGRMSTAVGSATAQAICTLTMPLI